MVLSLLIAVILEKEEELKKRCIFVFVGGNMFILKVCQDIRERAENCNIIMVIVWVVGHCIKLRNVM